MLQYAKTLAHNWAGGIAFCDLTDAHSAEDVCISLADVLGIPLVSGDDVELLGRALATRGRSLVILDNFEQIVGVARRVVERWLQLAEQSVFLVTSRTVLSIQGEQIFDLPPLSNVDAVALFIERARTARPAYQPDAGELEHLDELVRLLDRLPLAIELAAARSRVLSTAAILSRLGDRFRLLASKGYRSSRQATLRGAIDWSWSLLDAWEKSTLAQLSVFEGGFDLDAIEHVIALDDEEDAPWAIDAVQSLVEKSLIRRVGDDRFDLLVSVREYAAEKLERVGDVESTKLRHAAYFASFGRFEAIEAIARHDGLHVSDTLVTEFDNVRAAMSFGLKTGAKSIAFAATEHCSLCCIGVALQTVNAVHYTRIR